MAQYSHYNSHGPHQNRQQPNGLSQQIIENLCEENGGLTRQVEDLQADNSLLLEEREELFTRLDTLEREVQRREQAARDFQAMQEEIRSVKKLYRQAQADKTSLEEQVVHYKKQVASTAHSGDQLADDVIQREFEEVFNSIQQFVAANYRGVKFGQCPTFQRSIQRTTDIEAEFQNLSASARLAIKSYAPDAEHLQKRSRLKLIMSVIGQSISDSLSPDNYFGSPSQNPSGAAAYIVQSISSELEPSVKLLRPADTNTVPGVSRLKKWLTETRNIFIDSAPHKLQKAEEELAGSVANDALCKLNAATGCELTYEACNELVGIVSTTHEFYRKLQSQISHYEVEMMAAYDGILRANFNPKLMSQMDGYENEKDLVGREVEISVFPMLYKLDKGVSSHCACLHDDAATLTFRLHSLTRRSSSQRPRSC
jgi:hypothetical protein